MKALVYVDIDQGIHKGIHKEKDIKKHKMKNGKSNSAFLYTWNMANFEAFRWNFSSSTNPEIGKSGAMLWIQNKLNFRLILLFGDTSE